MKSILITLVCLFSLVGCSTSNNEPTTTHQSSVQPSTNVSNSSVIPETSEPPDEEDGDNLFYPNLVSLSELFYSSKDDVLRRLGDDYEVIPAGAEHLYDGYFYNAYGITILFEPYDFDKIALIACNDRVDISGAKIGMTFGEIQTYLPKCEVFEITPIEPFDPTFALTFEFEDVIIWFGAVEWVGDELRELSIEEVVATELQIRRNNMS